MHQSTAVYHQQGSRRRLLCSLQRSRIRRKRKKEQGPLRLSFPSYSDWQKGGNRSWRKERLCIYKKKLSGLDVENGPEFIGQTISSFTWGVWHRGPYKVQQCPFLSVIVWWSAWLLGTLSPQFLQPPSLAWASSEPLMSMRSVNLYNAKSGSTLQCILWQLHMGELFPNNTSGC